MNPLSRRHLLAVPLLAATSCLADEEEKLDLPDPLLFEPDPDYPEGLLFLSARRKYSKAKAQIRADYRERYANVLQNVNRAVIFLLDFHHTQDDTKIASIPENLRFYIKPYRSTTRILERKELKDKEAIAAKEHIQRLLKTREDRDGGAWCHHPVHGIRLYRDKELLFQTSFCWACTNYFMEYPDDPEGEATWVGLDDSELEEFLKIQMPIPPEVKKRFEEMFPEQK